MRRIAKAAALAGAGVLVARANTERTLEILEQGEAEAEPFSEAAWEKALGSAP